MHIEKSVLKYPVSVYSQLIRVMADRGFVEDYVFWEKYVFQYVYRDPRNDGYRVFSGEEAKMLWDSFVYLKLKCPSIEIKDVLSELEKHLYAADEEKRRNEKRAIAA